MTVPWLNKVSPLTIIAYLLQLLIFGGVYVVNDRFKSFEDNLKLAMLQSSTAIVQSQIMDIRINVLSHSQELLSNRIDDVDRYVRMNR